MENIRFEDLSEKFKEALKEQYYMYFLGIKSELSFEEFCEIQGVEL